MYRAKTVTISLFILLLCGSLFLAYERQGLLPWSSALLSGIGLITMLFLRGRQTLYCLIFISSLVGLSWAGTIYYVYSTWESGEVVQIQLQQDVMFRTWVVERDGKEVVIYDCPPEHQSLVESSTAAWVSRGSEQYDADLRAVPVTLDSDELASIFALYEKKYANQSRATNIYYLAIGARRGSQIYVLYLTRKDE